MPNPLSTVGDNGTLGYCLSGTLTGGTLSSGTLSAGRLGGAVVAVGTIIPFAGIIDLEPNKVKVKQVNTTILNSVADESQPGTPDHGEVKMKIEWTAAIAATIAGWVNNKTVLLFQMTADDFVSTDSSNTFLGYIIEYPPMGDDLKKDDRIEASITIKITGKPLPATGS